MSNNRQKSLATLPILHPVIILTFRQRCYRIFKYQFSINLSVAHFSSCIVILLTTLLTVGCGNVQFSEYPVELQKDKCIQSEDGNITVYAELVNDKNACQKYFGTSLQSRQILPVFVYIQNTSENKTFLVEEDFFSFQGTSKSSLNTDKEQSVVGTAVFAGILAAPIISLPIVAVVGGKAITDVARVEQNFYEKQFKRKTLSPGKEAHGFVYFNWSNDNLISEDMVLEITALDIQSSEKFKYQVDNLIKENAQ